MRDESDRSDAMNMTRRTAVRVKVGGCNLMGAIFAAPRDGEAANGRRS
jgi:hypothetical protein